MRRSLLAAAAALVLGVSLAHGPANAAEDPTLTGAPAVGDCFDITEAQTYPMTLPGEEPVDCAEDHTALVVGVGRLPRHLTWASPMAEVRHAMSLGCAAGYRRLIGTDDRLYYRSQYYLLQFIPTAAQRDAGARWFDCMMAIGNDTGLVDLPRTLPRLGQRIPDLVARCVTASLDYTTCADTHAWRSSFTFFARGKPTGKNIDAAADRVCPHHVTSRTWVRDAWDVSGPRFIVGCYSKDRH